MNKNFMKPRENNVKIRLDHLDGTTEWVEGNIVVNNARATILRALTGGSNATINHFRVGRTANPPAAAVTDSTNSDSSSFRKDFNPSDFSISGTILTMTLVLERNEAPDGTYTECTVHTADNALVARLVLTTPIQKDSSVRATIEWEIGY